MREYQGKRRLRRIFYSLPVRLLLAALLIVLLDSVYDLYRKDRLLRQDRQALIREIERLEERYEQLSRELADLQTARGVEAEIREKFNVVKPGENVISLLPAFPTSTPPLTKNWWESFLNWFE